MTRVSLKQAGAFLIGVAVGVLFVYNYSRNQEADQLTRAIDNVVLIHAIYPVDYSDDRILIGAAHNVFVGKVVRQVGTKERGIGPETQFEIEVIDNIKGELKGIVVVNQQGGSKEGVLYAVEGDTFTEGSAKESLLQIGSTYLFTTRYNSSENWNTLISFPGANIVLDSSNKPLEELKTVAEQNVRVEELKSAYINEILLKADVVNKNTKNSFSSLRDREENNTLKADNESTDSGPSVETSSGTVGDVSNAQSEENIEPTDTEVVTE